MEANINCKSCGKPNHLTEHVLRTYIPVVKHIYCHHCVAEVEITEEFKQSAREIKA